MNAHPAQLAIAPFPVQIGNDTVTDLRERLRRTRWPEAATVPGWEQGVPLDHLRELCRYRAEEYDFAGAETRLNEFRTAASGWTVERIAGAWLELMSRLGCHRFGAQGHDWGTSIGTATPSRHPHVWPACT